MQVSKDRPLEDESAWEKAKIKLKVDAEKVIKFNRKALLITHVAGGIFLLLGIIYLILGTTVFHNKGIFSLIQQSPSAIKLISGGGILLYGAAFALFRTAMHIAKKAQDHPREFLEEISTENLPEEPL